MPGNMAAAAALNWHEISLQGSSAQEYGEQLKAIDDILVDGWEVKVSEKTGNPRYVRPSVLVIFREDNRFLLDSVIPRRGQVSGDYDLILRRTTLAGKDKLNSRPKKCSHRSCGVWVLAADYWLCSLLEETLEWSSLIWSGRTKTLFRLTGMNC